MTEKAVKLSEIIAKPFWLLHSDIKSHLHSHYWLAGGRGSTKSSFISIAIILLLIRHRHCNAVIMRKVGNTLKNSVYSQMQWSISILGLDGYFKQKVSPLEMIYKPTGQKILYFGVDDKSKLKSIKLSHGYVGIVWLEELDQFAGMEEIRSLHQSLLRGGEMYWCFYSYNPPRSRDNWVNQEVLLDDNDRFVHRSTYLDVPEEWLGQQFILEAEKLKAKNEMSYHHEYLGEVTGTGGDVFENVVEARMTDEQVAGFDKLYFGLDFGFAIDPLAFVCCYYDKKREELWLYDEIYRHKLDTRPACGMIKEKAGRKLVIADSAEPRSIRAFQNEGCNIRGARKGPDSVEHGIKWLQGLRAIYIDKQRAPNTYQEFTGYEYARNKDGQFISQYPDKNNHSIDAVRYAMEPVSVGDTYSFS